MEVSFERNKGTLITYLYGEIDHHSSKGVKDKIDFQLMKPVTKSLVLDFRNVTFMDSSGIGIIFGRFNNVKSFEGRMAITGLSEKLLRVIKLAGVNKYMSIYEKVEEALNDFES